LNERVATTASRFAAIAKIANRKPQGPDSHVEVARAGDEPGDRRWLLTSCVAGIAGSMIAGAALLGILANSQAPNALASVRSADGLYAPAIKGDVTGSLLDSSALKPVASLLPAAQLQSQPSIVVPERDLAGDRNYPGISSEDLPYGDGHTVVLDAEIDIASVEAENITTITKSPPRNRSMSSSSSTAKLRSSRS
jgi:hypothetical protein